MCEFSTKLIAWLDQELPEDQAARLEGHLANCPECRKRLAAYREVSSRIAAYCHAIGVGPAKPRQGWVAVAGAAVAAGILFSAVSPRTAADRISLPPPLVAHAPAIAWQKTPAPIQTIYSVPAQQTTPAQNASWHPSETDIQIAIPAEAIFPPGALPEGFQFIADVTVAADGSPQGLRLRPY